jgi:vacuolar-type H+-ATPase subunit E/Vma4
MEKNTVGVNTPNAQEIIAKIHQDAQAQGDELLSWAQKETAKIKGEGLLKAGQAKDILDKELEIELVQLRQKVFSTLNLEKRKIFLTEQSRFVENVLESVKKEAANFRANHDYRNFLLMMIAEAVPVIAELKIVILFSFNDEGIFSDENFRRQAQDVCQKAVNNGCVCEFIKSDNKDIGIIAQSQDGRLIYDNTFTSRLKRMREDIYRELLKKIN